MEKIVAKKVSVCWGDDSFSNSSTKFTLTNRYAQDGEDSDSEDGPFAPLSNTNMKVYSIEGSQKPQPSKGTEGESRAVRGGSILAALRRSKQKQSTGAQVTCAQH